MGDSYNQPSSFLLMSLLRRKIETAIKKGVKQMRKLRKNHTTFENSVEAYSCVCSCTCECPVNANLFNSNASSVHNPRWHGNWGAIP